MNVLQEKWTVRSSILSTIWVSRVRESVLSRVDVFWLLAYHFVIVANGCFLMF